MTEITPAFGFPVAPRAAGNGVIPVAQTGSGEPRLRLHAPDGDGFRDDAPAEESLPTEAERLSAEIVDRVLKAAHRLRSALSGHFAEFDLSDVRFAVLRFLHDSEPAGCTQSELAQRLDQSESSISTLVKRMRDSGLLYRLRSTIDKRKWALKLTESGRGHFQSAQTCHARRMGGLLTAFDESERRHLAQLLDKLVMELAEARCGETSPAGSCEPKRESAVSSAHCLPESASNSPAA